MNERILFRVESRVLSRGQGTEQRYGTKMEYLIGVILALAAAGLANLVGFDREGSFFSTVLIVVASYYVLFAAMGAPASILVIEAVVAGGFVLMAVLGFK